MKEKTIRGPRHLVMAVCAALVVAACAAPPPDAREGTVVVTKVDRAAWNAPSEPRLYRVEFDAQAAQWIRRQSGILQAPESQDAYFSQVQVLEDEVGRELRARAFCSGSAQFVSFLDGAAGQPGITAIFRCRLPLFW